MSEPTGIRPDDAYGGRRPTSHERRAGGPWDASYVDGPGTGPHPVTQDEMRAAFGPGSGWSVDRIDPDRCQTRLDEHGAPAWLARIDRIQAGGPGPG